MIDDELYYFSKFRLISKIGGETRLLRDYAYIYIYTTGHKKLLRFVITKLYLLDKCIMVETAILNF